MQSRIIQFVVQRFGIHIDYERHFKTVQLLNSPVNLQFYLKLIATEYILLLICLYIIHKMFTVKILQTFLNGKYFFLGVLDYRITSYNVCYTKLLRQ